MIASWYTPMVQSLFKALAPVFAQLLITELLKDQSLKEKTHLPLSVPLENAPSRLIYRSKEHIKCIKNK
jgi:hypothetical protein